MRRRQSPYVVHLTEEEHKELSRWLRSTTMPAGLCAERAPSCWSLKARASQKPDASAVWADGWYDSGFLDSPQSESRDSMTSLGGAKSPLFPLRLHYIW